MDGFVMKRSEMMFQLIQLLVLCKNNDLSYDKTAEEILCLIEDRGMKPPYAEFHPVDYKVEYGFFQALMKIWANKWEPGDE